MEKMLLGFSSCALLPCLPLSSCLQKHLFYIIKQGGSCLYFSPGFALICLWSVIIIMEELFCFNKLPGCISLCCEVPCKLCVFLLQLLSCVLCVLWAGDVTCTQSCSFQIKTVIRMNQESAAPLPVELESGLGRGRAGWCRLRVEHRVVPALLSPHTPQKARIQRDEGVWIRWDGVGKQTTKSVRSSAPSCCPLAGMQRGGGPGGLCPPRCCGPVLALQWEAH